MKIGCVLADSQLVLSLKQNRYMKEHQLYFYDSADALANEAGNRGWQAVIVSQQCLGHAVFADFVADIRMQNRQLPIIVLLSNDDDRLDESYMRTCVTHRCETVSPDCSVQEAAEQIVLKLFGSDAGMGSGNKIVCFCGTTPNIGTTVVSFGMAAMLAQTRDSRIGYLCLNLKSSKLHRYLGRDKPKATLDGLRAELKSASLKPERLLHMCDRFPELPNLFVLYGNMLREQAEYYTPEDIEHLLRIADQTFDLCVVETNAYWDNAATVCGARIADTKLLVTTMQLPHFQEDFLRWIRSAAPIAGISPADFEMFLTQKRDSREAGGFRTGDVRRDTELNIFGEVGYYPFTENYLSQGRLLEMVTKEKELFNDLFGPAAALSEQYNLAPGKVPDSFAARRSWLTRILARS